MPTNRYTWAASPIAQVDTFQAGGSGTPGSTYAVTINNKTVEYTEGAAETDDTVAAGLQALLEAATYPEFQEVTWTVDGDTITATSATEGVPFTATESSSGGSLTKTSVTAATGPEWYDNIQNWSLGAVPVNGDDVVIAGSAQNIRHGLAQSAVTLASLTIDSTFTGQIGNPTWNPSLYYEYRATYLQTSASLVFVGSPSGGGSGLIRLSLGSNAANVTVYSTGSRVNDGTLPCLTLRGSHASNVLNMQSGDVGVAYEAGETASFPSVLVGYLNQASSDVQLKFGSGATLTTVGMSGGDVQAQTNVTTVTMDGGTFTLRGSATVTTLTCRGGTFFHQSSGTITTAVVGGTLDFGRDRRARTVTNTTVLEGGTLLDPAKTVTFTNPILLSQCGLADVTLDLGQAISLQRS